MRHNLSFVALLAALMTFSAADAHANMRAPQQMDGDVAVARVAAEAVQNIVLESEQLEITLPRLRVKEWDRLEASVSATYQLRNDGEEVRIPIVFMATNLLTPRVTVNGAELPTPVLRPMTDPQRAELDGMIKQRHRRDGSDEPGTASFEVVLAPGKNTVNFTYAQALRYGEGSSRYGAPTHKHASWGVDYLLYPAEAWRRAPSFALDVRVVVPDVVNEGWLWDSYIATDTTATAKLNVARDEKERLTILSGKFAEFPVEVLSITVYRKDRG